MQFHLDLTLTKSLSHLLVLTILSLHFSAELIVGT